MKIKNVWFFFAAVVFLTVAGCRGGEFKTEEPAIETPGPAIEVPGDPDQPTVKYVLTFSKQGSAGGAISEPAGMDCEGDCSAEFEAGTVVVLKPKSVLSNSKLKLWSENCAVPEGYSGAAESRPCEILMDADKTVTATFELTPPYPGIEIDRTRDLREKIKPRLDVDLTP